MCFFSNNTAPEALRESVKAYKDNIGHAQPFVPGGVNNQVAGFVNALCTTNREDRDRIRWLAATKMVEHTLHGSTYMTSGWPDPENMPASYAHVMSGDTMTFHEAIKTDPDAVAKSMLEAGMVAAGTPDDCLEVLSRFKGVGIDDIILHLQMGGVPHADIMTTIETLGTEVFPHLRS